MAMRKPWLLWVPPGSLPGVRFPLRLDQVLGGQATGVLTSRFPRIPPPNPPYERGGLPLLLMGKGRGGRRRDDDWRRAIDRFDLEGIGGDRTAGSVLLRVIASTRLLLCDLLSFLAEIPDPRSRHGRQHSLSAVLGLACCVIMCGARATPPSPNGPSITTSPSCIVSGSPEPLPSSAASARCSSH